MKPQQRVIIYQGGIRKKTAQQRYFDEAQERFASSDNHRACTHCGRYVKVAASGRLHAHRMGVGINNISCLNPL